jgi:hypothetical protein
MPPPLLVGLYVTNKHRKIISEDSFCSFYNDATRYGLNLHHSNEFNNLLQTLSTESYLKNCWEFPSRSITSSELSWLEINL